MWWSFFSTTLPYFEAVFLPIKAFPDLGIDIRRKVLIGYRDYVILPLYPRLEGTLPNQPPLTKSHLFHRPTRNANQTIHRGYSGTTPPMFLDISIDINTRRKSTTNGRFTSNIERDLGTTTNSRGSKGLCCWKVRVRNSHGRRCTGAIYVDVRR
jgi:hypothetical protein